MHPTALPRGLEAAQEVHPEGLCLGWHKPEADDLSLCPSLLAATAMIAAPETILSPWRVSGYVASSTDRAVTIGFHDRLRNRLGNAAKKIAAALRGQKLGKVHVGFGHRGLRIVAVDVAKLPLTVHLDGHLALHR